MRWRRQILEPEPTDAVVFLRSDVLWDSLPFTHEPSAQDGRLIHRSRLQSAQMRHRARGDLHEEDVILSDQRAYDDLVHVPTQARTTDARTSRHATVGSCSIGLETHKTVQPRAAILLSVEDIASAVSRAARNVHVPGTPLTLRLERVRAAADVCLVEWSYRDPTGESSDGRIRGETSVDIGNLTDGDLGELCWDAAQLAAAHRWKYELDGDELPGVPYVPRTWTVDEAWEALLALLGRYGTVVRAEGGEITLREGETERIFRLDPAHWAACVSLPEKVTNRYIVPTAVALANGLPLWVSDEVFEVLGSSTGVIGLVNGSLRPLSGR